MISETIMSVTKEDKNSNTSCLMTLYQIARKGLTYVYKNIEVAMFLVHNHFSK